VEELTVALSGRKPSLFWLEVEEKKEGERGVKREDGWLAWWLRWLQRKR
jgi:hypothetical protein